MPRKKKNSAAIAALEAAPLEPTTVAEALDQSPAVATILAAREAKSRVEPEREMPEPSHAQQLGPRKRAPGEPAAVYTSLRGGFKLLQDGPFRKFKFDSEPSREVKDKLEIAGFHYLPAEKAWCAAANWQVRDASDKLALELDGKDISHGRGA